MKLSAVLFALLLIASSCSRASSAPAGPDVPTCCTTYITHKIPRNLIRSHFSTSTSCSQPAIIFITKKKRAVCANPSEPWVQSYLQSARQD
ncbi:C-C motif chemokine 4-like [Excalfactoria chinensis]|uniref:C-C motif chemokine 4-like n=1 Tax=Excalfactoria chinensis TaxID=46218 RepID=UPI003B3A8F20